MIDRDPSKSLVARLKAAFIDESRCKISSTKKQIGIKLQKFMDNIMSNLTVTQQRIRKMSLEKITKKFDDCLLTSLLGHDNKIT